MRRFRLIPVLLILFALLAAAVALQNQHIVTPTPWPTITPTPAISPTPTGTLLRVFPDLAVLDIQAIRLQNIADGTEITLARDAAGNWTMPDTEQAVDSTGASAIARTLVLFPYAHSINILDDTKFSDYGFDPNPELLISILKTDGETHTIAVGNLMDSALAYYVLVDERDEIFLVERGAVDFLRNSIASPPFA